MFRSFDPEKAATAQEIEFRNLESFKKEWRATLVVPFKISFCAAVTGLLNSKNYDIAQEIVSIAAELINEALKSSQFRTVKLIVFLYNLVALLCPVNADKRNPSCSAHFNFESIHANCL
jgi:hypothetical protein